MMATGEQSKYMAVAATLASEKLEDLNRWDTDDPQICIPTGSNSVGSLTTDVLQTTTCPGGGSASIAYDDDVSLTLTNSTGDCPNSSAGCFAETVSAQVNGSTQYVTTYHSPDGRINTGAPNATPPGAATFHRRWVIEGNQPVTGTRRMTVLVTSNSVTPPARFQMSLVRP